MSRIPISASMVMVALILHGCGDPPNGDAPPAVEGAEAAAAETSPPAATPAAEVATYSVPDLSSNLGKQLVATLGAQPGVVSARVDEERGLFLVTFQPGQTDPAALLTQLRTVSAEATLTGVEGAATGSDKEGCGGCPSKSKCPKSGAASSG